MDNRYSKFTILIAGINRYISKIKSVEMKQFGLKSVHVSCLFYLYATGDDSLTASELCSLCGEDKGAISRSLDELESSGYLTSINEGLKKKYRAKLVLTEKGKLTGAKIVELIDEIFLKVSSGIKENDRKILYNTLDTINSNLKMVCENYGEKNENKNNN